MRGRAYSLELLLALVIAVVLAQRLRLVLSKGSSRIDVSLLSPKDGDRSCFQNVMLSSYLEIQMMDNVHNRKNGILTLFLLLINIT
jgi:hypothetical protein